MAGKPEGKEKEGNEGGEADADPVKPVASVASTGSSNVDAGGASKVSASKFAKAAAVAKANAAPITLGISLVSGVAGAEEIKDAKAAAHPAAGATPEPHEPHEPLTKLTRVGGGVGAGVAALGIYNGIKEYLEADKKHDKVGKVISGTDTLMGFTNLGIQSATAMGHEVAPLLEGGAKVGGTVVLVAQSAKAVYDAKGNFIDDDGTLGNKGEVAVKETVKVGAGFGVASVATGAVTAAGATGAMAVAAPVVLAGVAVYAIDKTGEAAIAANNAWKETDHQIEEAAKGTRTGPRAGAIQISDDPNRPDIRYYNKILPEVLNASANVRDDHITGGTLKRSPQGRIIPSPENAKILSDPRNLDEMKRAVGMNDEKAAQRMKDNDQVLPVVLRLTESAQTKTERYEMAKLDHLSAQSALGQIDSYRQERATYDTAHPPGQAGQAPASRMASATPPADPADIKAVQNELIKRHLYDGPADGKWNKDVNHGLNRLIQGAQAEGAQAGIYKGGVDGEYGHGTARVFAAGVAAKGPDAVDPAFLKAMNHLYGSGELKTVYTAEPAAAMTAPAERITVAAKADEVPVVTAPVSAFLKPPGIAPDPAASAAAPAEVVATATAPEAESRPGAGLAFLLIFNIYFAEAAETVSETAAGAAEDDTVTPTVPLVRDTIFAPFCSISVLVQSGRHFFASSATSSDVALLLMQV